MALDHHPVLLPISANSEAIEFETDSSEESGDRATDVGLSGGDPSWWSGEVGECGAATALGVSGIMASEVEAARSPERDSGGGWDWMTSE